MEPYTLNRSFLKRDIVDEFLSMIWTERYYGDGDIELVVPLNEEMINKVKVGMFIGIDESAEVMLLETVNVEKNTMKFSGISLTQWLNNRFVRASAKHEDRYWPVAGKTAGETLWYIVQQMCVAGSPYLTGATPIGITNPQRLAIPGLGLRDFDKSGPAISVGVPYGPVYDALKEIATTYEIGMQITLDAVTDTSYFLGFRSYKGLDRRSDQTVNAPVRFSPTMDSFTNIKELQSIAAFKTLVYAFAPGLNEDGGPVLATVPGVSAVVDPNSEYVGFDLRAQMVFSDDITTDMVGGSTATVINILNSRAADALTTNHYVKAVDGEIVPENMFQYGKDYNLGDLIEVEGYSGQIQPARITEYIRAQDEGGERAYPTVTMLD